MTRRSNTRNSEGYGVTKVAIIRLSELRNAVLFCILIIFLYVYCAQYCRALVLSSGRVVNQDGIPDELCTEVAHAQFQRLIAEHFRDGQGTR